jgi:hypothetical protein
MILPANGHLVPSASLSTEQTIAESCSAKMDCCKKAAMPRPSTRDDGINRPASEASEISESANVVACRLLPKRSPGFVTLKLTFDNAVENLAENSLPCIATAIEKGLSDSRLTLPQNRSGTYLRCCVFLI